MEEAKERGERNKCVEFIDKRRILETIKRWEVIINGRSE